MSTKVEILQPENKLSFSYRVTTDQEQFIIPVVDVRDGDAYVKRVAELEKGANRQKGSKFFLPTASWFGATYNQSMKKDKK